MTNGEMPAFLAIDAEPLTKISAPAMSTPKLTVSKIIGMTIFIKNKPSPKAGYNWYEFIVRERSI